MNFPLSIPDQERAPRRAQAPAGAQRAEGAPGLVTFKTSDTQSPVTVQIDAKKARMTRLRRSVTVAARLFGHSLSPRKFKPAMVTLTYRGVDDFCPRHISALIKHMRQWLARRGQNGRPLYTLQEMGAWQTQAMVHRYAHLSSAHLAKHAANLPTLTQRNKEPNDG